MNWQESIEGIAERLLDAVETARTDIKSLVVRGNEAVGSVEASVVVLNEAETDLEFLVSLNDKLDKSDVSVGRGEGFTGFVFDSGQVIAKVNPDTIGVKLVEQEAGVHTDYLLAVPVMADGRVVAVGTFVNRAAHAPDQAFIKDEIDVAQYFAGLYAVALKAHRQAVMTYRIACEDLRSVAEQMGVDAGGLKSLDVDHRFARGFEDTIFSIGSKLSPSQRGLWKRFGNFLVSEQGEEELD